ncbi:MAG TPA: hypothetical protein VGK74_26440 [Symbiobacteriaceae bacterium]|jgi:tetratricopeptide (TPR) repeat protein
MLLSFGDPGDLTGIGILPGDGYVDIDDQPPAEIAGLILERAGLPVSTAVPSRPAPKPETYTGHLRLANPHFVGRGPELKKLADAVGAGRIGVVAAVHGLGGMGKTELAITFAEREAGKFSGGRWILEAEGRKKLLPLFGELTYDLHIAPSAGPDETAGMRGQRVLDELKRRAAAAGKPDQGGSVLVVLDNVSEAVLLAEPQLAPLPHEDWLRIIVTTRLGREDLPKSLVFIPVDDLAEEDAVKLITDHQPDGRWPAATAPADEAATLEIAKELGGFTLAIEQVALYLGHHAIRPAAYLVRLRKEGLPSADALGTDQGVTAQMRHREKQLALVLNATLERLDRPARTALDYAALLPSDSVPWPWLRACVAREHPDALRHDEGYPDPWAEIRRRLEGLRLLTPGDHPEIARLHRLVGAHLRGRLPEAAVAVKLRQMRDKVEDFALELQAVWRHDVSQLWQLAPLQAAVEHWRDGDRDAAYGNIAGVVGDIEQTIGRLDRAEPFLQFAFEALDEAYRANPQSVDAAQAVSVMLVKLADFLVMRGQAGDAARALGYYERSLELGEQMLRENPEAARDVSLGLNKLADFLANRGQAGDEVRAMGDYERSLELRERLLRDHPQSAEAVRDVSVSLNKLADFLVRRGQAGDAARALGDYERSLELAEQLLRDHPQSAQAVRDVSASLNKLADVLTTRGQAGDAARALGYSERCLELAEQLLRENPQSAEATRDVLVSLERLAHVTAAQPDTYAARKALAFQQRALALASKLREDNPQSVFYGRTAAWSYYFTGQLAHAAGEAELAAQCLAGCYTVLHELISAGMELDEPMRNLYTKVKAALGDEA